MASSRGQGKRDDRDTKPSYVKPDQMVNEGFEQYYKAQAILPETEFPTMMQAFRDPLPTTFRVTGTRGHADVLNAVVRDTYVPFLSDVKLPDGRQIGGALQQIPWYPRQLAWTLAVDKQVIRKSPEFRRFQDFLVHETEAGNTTRQEVVSMIPPLVLDVQPHHYVLDMCAAPGSKTVQLLEALHAREDQTSGTEPATGLLIANDSDLKRTHMLVHQSLNRVGSPNMMVTQHDASIYPALRGTTAGDPLLFDRILADVPCSGDGTLRKNVAIWRNWTVADGLGLHALQLRILLRAAKLLRPGGRIVYSTCSLNPLENEAVVSAALSACPELSLVDVSAELPGLARRPGLTDWRVRIGPKQEEVEKPAAGVDALERGNKRYASTCWPAGDEAAKRLERCVRVYPHLNNTGGFFIAVLESTGATPAPVAESSKRPASPSSLAPEAKRQRVDGEADAAETSEDAVTVVADAAPSNGKAKLKKKAPNPNTRFKEDPYTYVAPDHPEIATFGQFFDVRPTFDLSNLLVRNADGDPVRTVYRTSPSVKAIVEANDYKVMRLISCGTRLLARQDANREGTYKCKWRLLSESLDNVRPHLGPARIVNCSPAAVRELVHGQYVAIETIRGADPAFADALLKLDHGSAVLECEAGELEASTDEPDRLPGGTIPRLLTLPLWKAPTSVQLMVDKKAKIALSFRIFSRDICTWQGGNKDKPKAGAEVEGAVPDPADDEPKPDDEADAAAPADRSAEAGSAA